MTRRRERRDFSLCRFFRERTGRRMRRRAIGMRSRDLRGLRPMRRARTVRSGRFPFSSGTRIRAFILCRTLGMAVGRVRLTGISPAVLPGLAPARRKEVGFSPFLIIRRINRLRRLFIPGTAAAQVRPTVITRFLLPASVRGVKPDGGSSRSIIRRRMRLMTKSTLISIWINCPKR